MARVASWRSALWARWLGWTVVFGLLFAGVMLPFAYHVPDSAILPVLAIFAASFGLCPIAAFWIGVRVPSQWWPAGPPAAIMAMVVAILVQPSLGPPRRTALGLTTPKDEFLFVLIWRGWIVLILLTVIYALLARWEVGVGQHRELNASRPGRLPPKRAA